MTHRTHATVTAGRDAMRRWLRNAVLVLGLLVAWAVAAPAAIAQTDGVVAQQPDPSDEIIKHIDEMTKIVQDNMDKPEEAKKALAAYIGSNAKAMKAAAESFETSLNRLAPGDVEKYKEGLQRKLEKSLESFLSAMLEFSEKHPEAAKELDELLKTK